MRTRYGSVNLSPGQTRIYQWASWLLNPIRVAADAWNQFWYSPSDPVVLALIRIFAGGMLLYTHIIWGLNLPAFFGSNGWNSPDVLAVVQEDGIVPSFWWYVSDQWLMPVHCLCIAILFLFWIGFATRVTSVLSMIITISYSYRAHMSNFGLDQLNAILCFYLCIGPSGALLSVDRWISVLRARRKARREGVPYAAPVVSRSITANLAIRLIQLHFCVIYAYAGLSKLQGGAWWSGEAVWLAFANLEYQSISMTWIAWYPWISDLMTHTTILWEVSFAALIWIRPVRPIVLAMGFAMHAGIGGMMGMWTFGLIMIFGHLSFWPAGTVRRLLGDLPLMPTMLGTLQPLKQTGQSARNTELKVAPVLLWVDRTVRRQLLCLRYFWQRGYHCAASRDLQEARELRETTSPDAVVVMATGWEDEEVTTFHDDHCSRPDAEPLFMILSKSQSARLNGRIHTAGSHVITGQVSLGSLRREIQETLNHTSDDQEFEWAAEHSIGEDS
ncbi:MAG TPA: HTTM domain-containing protein [Planctomycetaceae bacterium]|nr:HTTM domain-containing protein [Planctomycetaceae bacterium]